MAFCRAPFVASVGVIALLVFADTRVPGLHAADWPQFLGPNRNGASTESARSGWPAEGPRVLWSRSVGAGFSGPVVSGNRLVLHHREGSREVIECHDAEKGGKALWRHEYPTSYQDRFGFDEGPRGTPAVSGNRVFTLGASAVVTCVELETGKRVWTVDAAKEYGADQGYFGFACSPLVHEGRVMFNLGGRPGAGLVALDVRDGKLAWKATDHEAGYASPILARLGEATRALFYTREALVIVDPTNGTVYGQFPWRARMSASVNAATPLWLGDRVLLSTSYDTGAVLLDLAGGTPRKVWSNDASLSSHYASMVQRDGLVFGFHGRQESGTTLRCIDGGTGKVRWSQDGLGCGSVMLAADQLVVLTERGELIVAPAVAGSFQPKARAQVLGTGIRAYPAYANGRFYARDTRKLICLELGGR